MLMSPKTMWPALMLAARRKERVIGRTRILTDSMITKAGASQEGAPEGRNLAVNSLGELIKEDMIKANQSGIPKDIVSKR